MSHEKCDTGLESLLVELQDMGEEWASKGLYTLNGSVGWQ
jgi:hypothetical protein